MSYYYEYTFSDLAEFLSSPEGMAVAGVVLFFLAFLAVQYVFQSLSCMPLPGGGELPTPALPGCRWPIPGFWVVFRTNTSMWSRVRSAITGKYFWLWPLCPSFSAEQGFC